MNLRSSIPLVAIVTPVYNGERYLSNTIECVQALQYPRLIHIILDNASTDGTPEIISRYLNGRVPLRVSRNAATIPMVANFNAALSLVPEEAAYFRLLCADDLMTPNAITRKVELASRHPDVDIVGCLELSDELRQEHLPLEQEVFEGRAIAAAYLRRDNSVLSGTHFLFRRTQLSRFPLFYDEKFEAFADADANLRVCLCSKLGFIHEGLATWRRHDSNAWNRHAQSGITTVDWLALLIRYGTSVMEQNVYDSCVTAYRRHCLRRLLLLRWRDGDRATFDRHVKRLRSIGAPTSWHEFAGALGDWALLAATGRRHLVGVAR